MDSRVNYSGRRDNFEMNLKGTLLIFLFTLPSLLLSQWTYRSGSNKFDGSYKVAQVIGKGGEWPYKDPTFNIIRWNEDEPDIYIGNIRYTGCDDATIEITFNDNKEIYAYDANPSINKNAAYIDFSKLYSWRNSISMVELVELLRNENRLYIRYADNCGSEYYEFSLSGSTKAINFVAKEYFEELKEEKELDSIRAEIKRKEKEERELMLLQAEKKRLEKYKKDILAAFQFGDVPVEQSPLKKLFSFNFTVPRVLDYCNKQDSKGKMYPAGDQTFFYSTKLTIYNRISGDCILMTDGDWGKYTTTRYFVNIFKLANKSNSPQIQIIKDNWEEIVRLSSQDE